MQIVVIGGGPAGLSTALRLQQLGKEVLVLESGNYRRQRAGEHLSAEGHIYLRNLGVPESVWEENSIPCIGVLGAWGSEALISESSIYNPYGDGFILTRPGFDLALAEYCSSIGIQIKTGFHVRYLDQKASGWNISNGVEIISADFLIDASGRNSKAHLRLKSVKAAEDELIGISMSLQPKKNWPIVEASLMVESLPSGWWYSVQLASGELVATFMTDVSLLSQSQNNQLDFWNAALAQSIHTRQRCEAFQLYGKPFTQSAKTQYINPTSGPNWLAVGDAALSYDPLSSAGILKGLKMGQLAGTRIDEFLKGNIQALKKYDLEVERMWAEYLKEKTRVYGQEQRYMDQPFWYKRIFDPRTIQDFTLVPQNFLILTKEDYKDRLDFLGLHFPNIDLRKIIDAFANKGFAHLAIKEYLRMSGISILNERHLQAIESLKKIGILELLR